MDSPFEKEARELLMRVKGAREELQVRRAAEALRAVAEREWLAGLDFAGACLRAGCSLDEAASGNPHTKPNQGER